MQEAKRVCSHDGNVVLCMPLGLSAYVRLMADRLFLDTDVSEVIVPVKAVASRSGNSSNHATFLVCPVSPHSISNHIFRPYTEDEISQRFPKVDHLGRYRLSTLSGPYRKRFFYEIDGVSPPPGRSWTVSKDHLQHLISVGGIEFSASGQPSEKIYFSESDGVPIDSDWSDLTVLETHRHGVSQAGQQAVELLERVIGKTTRPNGLVVDPFCGSGTTAEAAMRLGRRWIAGDSIEEAVERTRNRLLDNLNFSVVTMPNSDFEAVSKAVSRNILLHTGLIPKADSRYRFSLGQPSGLEEARTIEFKEISGTRPVKTIENHADEYAVAYLNSEGGSIFWGIRNDGVVEGVALDAGMRDEVAKAIDTKLMTIQPSVSPAQFRTRFHAITDGKNLLVDKFVVELLVHPFLDPRLLFATSSHKVLLKTDSGKKKLDFLEVQYEVLRRNTPELTGEIGPKGD